MKILILALLIGVVAGAPSFEVHHRQTRNVASLLEDIIRETGIRDLLPWVQEKLQTDPDLQSFIKYLESGKIDAILDHLRACPGYDEVKNKLAAEGVDLVKMVEDIRKFITGQTGVSYKIQARSNLGELLNEFLARLDLMRVISVIKDKLDNDPDMKKVIDFVKGDTFQGIVTCMKQSKEVHELKEKLYDEGIDIESLIEMVKMLMGSGLYYTPEARTVGELLENLITELGLRDLLPWIKEMIQTDPDVQRVVEYLKSPAFKRIEEHLKGCPGYQEVKDKLKAEGVDLVEILERIRNFITGGTRANTVYYKIQPRRTLGELFDLILEKLDINKMISIIRDKFHGNPDLKKVIDFLKGDVFKGIVECMRKSPDVQDLKQKLEDEGIDIAGIIELVKSLLENQYYYSIESRTVGELLENLITELGLRDLLPWIKEMIQTDPDVQRVVEYLKSPAFKRIEEHLKACPGYQEVKDKLKAEGVDLVEILERIRNFLTGSSRTSTVYYKIQPRRTLGELFDLILEKLDINKMISIIRDKFHGNPDLKKVIDFLKGDVFKGIVECMRKSPDVQDLKQKLEDEGIDIAGIIELVKSLLENQYYYSIESRTVGELLESLITELGLRDLLPWIKEMIQTDPDVQRVVEYLKSPAFKRIEEHLKGCPGYQEVKDKLKAEGVDLVEILERIRNFITGGTRANTVYYKIQPRRTLGELLDLILEKLDINKMISIIHDKFANNPDLKKVIEFLKGDVFKGIVECMRKSPDVQDLKEKLEDEGVDVTGIIELIKSLLDSHYYSIQPRSVGTLLKDLVEELGLKELMPWIKEKIETDPDAQRIVDYLRGPVFQNIENHLRACPGYPSLRDKLKAEGVDLVEILQDIRNFFTGSSRQLYSTRSRRDLSDLINELLGKLDINHILAVIGEKIRTDPDMKKVIAFLKGDEFHGIVDCMRASKDVQDLVAKLADEGIDVVAIVELIKSLLGGM